jgi:hypothetical protein
MVNVDDDVGSDCAKAQIDTAVTDYGIVNVSSVDEKQKTRKEDSK